MISYSFNGIQDFQTICLGKYSKIELANLNVVIIYYHVYGALITIPI